MNTFEMNPEPISRTILPELPNRCVIVMDAALQGGLLANAIAVISLTVGQRHPVLVGEPLVDASGFPHPGLIPIGIPMLRAPQGALNGLRAMAMEHDCDVVDFPVEGQQTKDYREFMEMTANIRPEEMKYTGIAIVGQKKIVNNIVRKLDML